MDVNNSSVYPEVKEQGFSILSYSDLIKLDDDDTDTDETQPVRPGMTTKRKNIASGPCRDIGSAIDTGLPKDTTHIATLPNIDSRISIDDVVTSLSGEEGKETQITSKDKPKRIDNYKRRTKEELDKRLKCPECPKYRCWTEDRLVRHIRKVHRDENEFQCDLCIYTTYNKVAYEEHMRIHNGIKPFTCKYCDYRSASKKNAKLHENKHRPCPDCGFFAKNAMALKKHQRKEHSGQKKGKIRDETIHTCNLCKKELIGNLKKKWHYSNRRKCNECSYVSCSKTLHVQHMEQEHGITVEKKPIIFSCSHCTWSSSNMLKILLHLIHHPNQAVDESVIDITVLKKCGIMK